MGEQNVTLEELQQLESIADEATETGDPEVMRTLLKRSLSLSRNNDCELHAKGIRGVTDVLRFYCSYGRSPRDGNETRRPRFSALAIADGFHYASKCGDSEIAGSRVCWESLGV